MTGTVRDDGSIHKEGAAVKNMLYFRGLKLLPGQREGNWKVLAIPTKKTLLMNLFAGWLSVAGAVVSMAEEKVADSFDWDLYDQLLSEYVSEGEKQGSPVNLVDYSGLRTDARFEVLIDQLKNYPQPNLKSREEKLSFYINAYNILTLKIILDHWQVDSIRDIGNWLRDAWDIPVLEVNGQSKSLDDIEHGILRPMGEVRVHFALNCASVSCPNLRLQAYRSDLLYGQLDDQVEAFLNQSGKGMKLAGDVLHLCKIFKWYDDDFDQSGGVRAFIQQKRPGLKFKRIKFDLDYNWDLNGY